MKFQTQYHKKLGKLLSPFKESIVINSYGRSGSTMLAESIATSAVPGQSNYFNRFRRKILYYTAWNLNSDCNTPNLIYKSHDYPPQVDTTSKKYIYIFSDPTEVVLSLLRVFEEKGEIWMRQHFENLKSKYVDNFLSIINHDTLNLERHFDCWLSEKRLRVAFVRYEKLWENEKKLSEFIGFSLKLPQYKERKARQQYDPQVITKIRSTYYSLNSKISKCEDFFVRNK